MLIEHFLAAPVNSFAQRDGFTCDRQPGDEFALLGRETLDLLAEQIVDITQGVYLLLEEFANLAREDLAN
jgi:hypothetical protein